MGHFVPLGEPLCQWCHSDTVSDSQTISTISNHVNKVVNLRFNSLNSSGTYSFDGISQGPGSITRTPGGTTQGQCSNLYCHSIVQTATGGPLTGAAGEYKSPVWGGALPCGDCHKSEAYHNTFYQNSNPIMDSGSHSQHLAYNFTTGGPLKCVICHKWNPNQSLTQCNQCHYQEILHANGIIDMAFNCSRERRL
jgi:predicted CxxxxCH...CXXCH cytochrome family protein